MKSTFLILLLTISFGAFSQSGQVCGYKVYKGDQTSTDSSIREFTKVKTLADGNVVYAGQADEGADANFSLTKTNSEGVILWQKVFGTDGIDVLKDFALTADGGFVLAGWTTATGDASDPSDGIVVRCDPSGEVIWSKLVGGADDDEAFNATELTNGEFIVTGSTFSFGPKLKNAFAAKLSADGDLVWSRGFAKGAYNYFINTIALPDNEAILCGYTWITTGTTIFDPMFVKIQSDGSVVWAKWVKMNNSQIVYDFEKDLDGGIVYAGVSTTGGANQNFIAKVSATGNHQWARLFGTSFGDRVWDLAVAPSGKYITVGFTDKSGVENSPRNGFVARLSSTGIPEESIQYGSSDPVNSTTFTGVAVAGDYLYATGLTYMYGNTTGAGVSSKLVAGDLSQNCSAIAVNMPSTSLTGVDSAGVQFTEGGNAAEAVLASRFNNLVVDNICIFTKVNDEFKNGLFSVFPNPSQGLFQVSIPAGGPSTILVNSADGREMLRQTSNSGSVVDVNASGLPAGFYHIRVMAGAKIYQSVFSKN